MSVENRPNLHAVGVVVDLMDSFEQRVRGEAKKNMPKVRELLRNEIIQFVERCDEILDEHFGR